MQTPSPGVVPSSGAGTSDFVVHEIWSLGKQSFLGSKAAKENLGQG